MVRTGAFVYAQWGKESTFGTAPTQADITIPFGYEPKLTGWSLTNNRITLAQLNSKQPVTYAYGQTRGSLGVDFVLSNPWLFSLLFSKDSGAGFPTGTGPYTYNWIDDASSETVASFSTEIGLEDGATDAVRTLTGCVLNSVSLRSSVGDVVRASADISYANETYGATLDSTPANEVTTEHIPFTFAHGKLEMPTGTPVLELQDFEITLNQNSELLYGHNSNIAVGAYRRLFEVTGRFRASWAATTGNTVRKFLDFIYAQTEMNSQALAVEQPSITIVFDNTESGTSQRQIKLTLAGISLGDISTPLEPNEPIFQEITFQARTCTPVAINNLSSPPGASID